MIGSPLPVVDGTALPLRTDPEIKTEGGIRNLGMKIASVLLVIEVIMKKIMEGGWNH